MPPQLRRIEGDSTVVAAAQRRSLATSLVEEGEMPEDAAATAASADAAYIWRVDLEKSGEMYLPSPPSPPTPNNNNNK